MKIFNNNGNVVYVQLKDLYILYCTGEEIPVTIYNRVFKDPKVYNSNLDSFIRFDNMEEISFFIRHQWIISWNYYSECSKEDILNDIEINTMNCEGIKSRIIHNQLDKEEINELSIELTHLSHKINSFNNILDYKNDKVKIPFPLEPDSYGLILNESIYKIYKAIDPKILLICRKDGKRLSGKDSIDSSLIKYGIYSDIMDGNNTEYLEGKYKIDLELSNDKKYLIIKYVPNKEYINEELKDNTKTGIGRILNKIVKR